MPDGISKSPRMGRQPRSSRSAFRRFVSLLRDGWPREAHKEKQAEGKTPFHVFILHVCGRPCANTTKLNTSPSSPCTQLARGRWVNAVPVRHQGENGANRETTTCHASTYGVRREH